MINYLLLLISPFFLTEVHFGNTENGLGMIIANGDMTRIAVFKDGKANSWSILSDNFDGYYLEKVGEDENGDFIKIEYVSPDKYSYEVKMNSEEQKGFLRKSERLKFICDKRKKLLKKFGAKYPNISFNNRLIEEENGSKRIQIKFKRNGEVTFVQIEDGKQTRSYNQQLI